MHWKNLSNYDYLGAYSLDGRKDDVILTIKEIKRELVTAEGGKKENCIVAYFEENNVDSVEVKPMVLNKTNCKTIEKVYGTGEVENWIGKKIQVFATTTKFGRDNNVPCLRIRPEIPKEIVYACEVCGKVIDAKTYNATKKAYGVGLCSAECKEEYLNKKENKEEGKE